MAAVVGERALDGKVAVVTGSSRNIGRAIVHALAANGAAVVVHGSQDLQAAEATAREVQQAYGVKTLVHLAEIGDAQACPGHIDTSRGLSAGATSTVTESRAMSRKGMPEEIAAMVCHLCLPVGRYVTGQCIHVNGGMLFTGA